MKTTSLILVVLALAGTTFAKVDPTRPMVTGRGNVAAARSAKVIVTNQTAPKPEESVKLDKFVVTGSLVPKSAVKLAAKQSPARH